MELNWTVEVFLSFISVFLVIPSLVKTFLQYHQDRKIHYLLYILLSSSVTLWAFLQGISLLFLDFTLHKWSYYVLIPFAFIADLLFDAMTKESVEPVKLTILAAMAAFIVYSSFEIDAVNLKIGKYGEVGLIYGGIFQISVMVLLAFVAIFWEYYVLKLFHFAPKGMKKAAAMSVWGSLLTGIIAPFTAVFGLNSYIPGINKPLFALGLIVTLMAFIKEPRLMYVFPFRISFLYVIDSAGIPLFSHSWSEIKDPIKKGLFSGMIVGIQSILHETLDKGDVREIVIDQSTLLIKSVEKFRFACVLIASKTSRTLRVALDDFAEQFLNKFRDKLDFTNDSTIFKDAILLVKDCFPFVPY